jgi:hypothetical protein
VTRLELARAEIARRRALAESVLMWRDGDEWKRTVARIGGGTVSGQHAAANDPAHVLRVLAAADAVLDRHWPDPKYRTGGQPACIAGNWHAPWPCADAQTALDLYAPQEQP